MQDANELERVALWRDFLLESGASSDRHPVALFGKPVVDRIFAGSNSWHWRQLSWPALIGISVSFGFLSWIAFQSPNSILYGWCSGAVAVVSLAGAFHLWNDHRNLPIGELHLLAETEEQHAWLDRLDGYQGRIERGEKKVYSGNDSTALDGKHLTGNNGRILILDSCYGRTDRARKYRSKKALSVDPTRPVATDDSNTEVSVAGAHSSVEPVSDVDSQLLESQARQEGEATDPVAPESKSLPPADSIDLLPSPMNSRAPTNSLTKVQPHHHFHGLKRNDFELYLDAFLASKRWNIARKVQFRATQRAAYDLIQVDPHPHQGAFVGAVRKRAVDNYDTELTLGDVSISKLIGNGEAHRNSEFRRFVLQQRDQTALLSPKIPVIASSDQELPGNTE